MKKKHEDFEEMFDTLNPSFHRIMDELHRAYETCGFCPICGGGAASKRMEKILAEERLKEVEKVCAKEHEPLLKRIKDYQETATNALREARDAKASMEREVKERNAAERKMELAEAKLKNYERALLRIIVTVGKSKEPVNATLAEMVESDKVMKALSAEEMKYEEDDK